MASVAGSIILIAILEVYFLAVVVAVIILYGYFAMFYQASARELKRIDSLLRSIHYAHFSESLTGLPTIVSCNASSGLLQLIHTLKKAELRRNQPIYQRQQVLSGSGKPSIVSYRNKPKVIFLWTI